jgi:hypothetical protein
MTIIKSLVMENEFASQMKNRSDQELLEIVTTFKNDYQSDAVLAAEIELKNRELSKEDFDEIQENVSLKEKK